MNRREFLHGVTLAAAVRPLFPQTPGTPLVSAPSAGSFELDEATLAELQEGLKTGRFTAQSLVEKYLARIGEIDRRGPALRSVIELNPDAMSIAATLDAERQAKGPRGPLHGIPVLIKDNIDTGDKMMTTAGSLALEGSTAANDSWVAERLRVAGAVILGKTNLSEWANFRSTHSSSGWSGRGGQTRSPYAADRNPCGSSSGTGAAVAANLCAVGVGTETDGSIVCPSAFNSLVGIKPTVGLIGRSGIIPISHSQDTAGPMARTVADAAILLGALTGVDPRDSVTATSRGKSFIDYTRFLDPKGLQGARIGVARKFFELGDKVEKVLNACIEEIRRQGAEVIDPADLPTHGKFNDSEFEVLQYEFKADLNKYLGALGPHVRVHSLMELIEFNEKTRDREMPYFGQEILEMAQKKGPLTEKVYIAALQKNQRLTRTMGIDAVMEKHRLDALVAPTGGAPWLTDLLTGDHDTGGSSSPAAVAGYPSITVPAGFVAGLPLGLSFFGRAYSEPKLIALAYSFEQATKARRPPRFLPTAEVGMETGLIQARCSC